MACIDPTILGYRAHNDKTFPESKEKRRWRNNDSDISSKKTDTVAEITRPASMPLCRGVHGTDVVDDVRMVKREWRKSTDEGNINPEMSTVMVTSATRVRVYEGNGGTTAITREAMIGTLEAHSVRIG